MGRNRITICFCRPCLRHAPTVVSELALHTHLSRLRSVAGRIQGTATEHAEHHPSARDCRLYRRDCFHCYRSLCLQIGRPLPGISRGPCPVSPTGTYRTPLMMDPSSARPAAAALMLELTTLLLTFIHALPDNNRRGIMPLTLNQHGAVSVLRSDATATPVNHERLLLRTHQACLALFQAHQSGQSTSHVIRSYSLVRRSFGAPSRQISAHLTWLTQAILFAEIRFVSHPTPALKSEPIQKAGGTSLTRASNLTIS
jgi:hypothetical protein